MTRIRFFGRALALVVLGLGIGLMPSGAVDFTGGVMTAVPVKGGKAPKIDGDLSDWDLSAQEPVYISAQTADKMNAEWAVMYDDTALYFSAKVSMPDRPYHNAGNPHDNFWSGDILQVRMGVDPSLPDPMDERRDVETDLVDHISFWKNSDTGVSYVQITRGLKFNKGQSVMPEGSEVVLKTEGSTGYTLEAKVPWSALNTHVKQNPFKVGSKTAFIIETLWIGGDRTRVPLCYTKNPTTFAFNRVSTWGKLVFAEKSPGKRQRPTLAQIIAEAKEVHDETPHVGVPFQVDVPADGLHASVNIFDDKGNVLRELIGGETHPKGKLEVRWDGRDSFGKGVTPGTYKWGAYFHKPLVADYQGGVGSSANPYYQSLDGKGGWGGDHTNPIDVASDGTSFYMVWPTAEAGRPVIKTDKEGKVIWRKNPFVGGGWGPFYAVASDGKYVFMGRGSDKDTAISHDTDKATYLVRLDAQNGALLTWPGEGKSELRVFQEQMSLMPMDAVPLVIGPHRGLPPHPAGMTMQPDCMGLAVYKGKVYMGSYSLNKIVAVDEETGKIAQELNCPAPRGLTVDTSGNLYVASFIPGKKAEVLRFANAAGEGVPVVSTGLEAPYDVAVDRNGNIAVSDLGKSQQVKIFDKGGRLVKTLGQKGGRPWQGKYDAVAIEFLCPSGVADDGQGNWMVVESAPPKVISRIAQDSSKLVNRWFGPGVYWNSTWPMPEDPRHAFYFVNDAAARARVQTPDQPGVPDGYWAPDRAGFENAGNIENGIPQPEVIRAANGELYYVNDSRKHAILLLKNDLMRPVATWSVVTAQTKGNKQKRPYLDVWIDRNGDGLEQENEKEQLLNLGNGKPMPTVAEGTSSMHMEQNGDLYFTTQENCILKIPGGKFSSNGTATWDLKKASLAVPQVLPGADKLSTGYRAGLLGVRVDATGNIYTVLNAKMRGGTGAYDFVDEAAAKSMREGMGHTAEFNLVKFGKFSPDGKLLWMAGRKANAGAKPGEMYHFWNMAGIINNKYIAGGSEWGQIYIYTQDGFFVDALMNNPGDLTVPGPYTFGGETAGGRVAYFPQSDELWAYNSGMAYKVKGFSRGAVEGESRASGTVVLDKVYDLPKTTQESGPSLQISAVTASPLKQPELWNQVPVSIVNRNGKPLAQAQFAYDKSCLYGRIAVTDESPLQNDATQEQLVFKQGDTAGIVLGPRRDSSLPGLGDVRLMAVKIGGQEKLIAMKSETSGPKKPFEYFTPAGGKRSFAFVGEVPEAEVRLVPNEKGDGYVALFAVPVSFLEFELKPGSALRGDVEVRLSGVGQRGLQTVSRNYLFTPAKSETTMVDDVPTEARMYPEYWGAVEVK